MVFYSPILDVKDRWAQIGQLQINILGVEVGKKLWTTVDKDKV